MDTCAVGWWGISTVQSGASILLSGATVLPFAPSYPQAVKTDINSFTAVSSTHFWPARLANVRNGVHYRMALAFPFTRVQVADDTHRLCNSNYRAGFEERHRADRPTWEFGRAKSSSQHAHNALQHITWSVTWCKCGCLPMLSEVQFTWSKRYRVTWTAGWWHDLRTQSRQLCTQSLVILDVSSCHITEQWLKSSFHHPVVIQDQVPNQQLGSLSHALLRLCPNQDMNCTYEQEYNTVSLMVSAIAIEGHVTSRNAGHIKPHWNMIHDSDCECKMVRSSDFRSPFLEAEFHVPSQTMVVSSRVSAMWQWALFHETTL
jgi:hypothetical protein